MYLDFESLSISLARNIHYIIVQHLHLKFQNIILCLKYIFIRVNKYLIRSDRASRTLITTDRKFSDLSTESTLFFRSLLTHFMMIKVFLQSIGTRMQ